MSDKKVNIVHAYGFHGQTHLYFNMSREEAFERAKEEFSGVLKVSMEYLQSYEYTDSFAVYSVEVRESEDINGFKDLNKYE